MIEETEETPELRDPRPSRPPLPPPIRRIVIDAPPTVVAPSASDHAGLRTERAPAGSERMTLTELSVFYGSKAAVKEVSLPIRQGEVLALIGPSGCGKT